MKYFLRSLLAFIAFVITSACSDNDVRSVTLIGYNYTERPIGWFSVDDAGGSNVFAREKSGGGKMTCCLDIEVGKEVHVRWVYSYTKKQYMAGAREDEFEARARIPPPDSERSSYLEVHFYPDNHVELALTDFPSYARWDEIRSHGKLDD